MGGDGAAVCGGRDSAPSRYVRLRCAAALTHRERLAESQSL